MSEPTASAPPVYAANLVLTDLRLESRARQHWTESGIDSRARCLDRRHFDQYPYPVEYQYNSRGFRDQEWPRTLREMNSSIWCVGDSFTVGLGSPVEHTWWYQLGLILGVRTVNVSMDGASNDWISRRAQQIILELAPRAVVVHWSYIERRENAETGLSDEDRREFDVLDDQANIARFHDNVLSLERLRLYSPIVHTVIPEFTGNPVVRDLFFRQHLTAGTYVDHFQRRDLARDGHHYDIKTSQWLAAAIAERITTKYPKENA